MMASATVYGRLHAGACAILALFACITSLATRRHSGIAIAMLGLAAINPGWWDNAYKGDCGASMVFGSSFFTAIIGGLYAWHCVASARSLRQASE